MAPPKLARGVLELTAKTVSESESLVEAAVRLGIATATLANRLRRCDANKIAYKKPIQEPPVPTDSYERKDSSFWKQRAKTLADDLDRTRQELRAVAGLMQRPVNPPAWVFDRSSSAHKSAGLLHLSDLHMGEVIRANEIGGLNAYDPDVAVKRLRRLFASAIEIVPKWASDSVLSGMVVAINGDLVSGDIHEELRNSNALTAMEQAYLAADEISAGLGRLADTFGNVLAVFTPGNHGRTTEKTHAKRVSALSYDMLIGEMVRRHFAADERVTVNLASGPDAVYPVLGWTVHQSHGDSLGTGGGRGFAGPILPIARGVKNVELQAYLVRAHYDIVLTAHYHTSANPGGDKLANGSIVGYSEFANRLRAAYEPPQQWLALIHERWCIREMARIKLEDPVKPDKPRSRVAASGEKV